MKQNANTENAVGRAKRRVVLYGALIAVSLVAAYQTFEKGLPTCEAVVGSDFTKVESAMSILEHPVQNLPLMTANLKKYEGEIEEDLLAAAYFYKTAQYEKFGEFIGNLVKAVTQKEEAKPTTWADAYPHDNREAMAEFLQGFFKGTHVGQFDITALLVCIYGMDGAALAFY